MGQCLGPLLLLDFTPGVPAWVLVLTRDWQRMPACLLPCWNRAGAHGDRPQKHKQAALLASGSGSRAFDSNFWTQPKPRPRAAHQPPGPQSQTPPQAIPTTDRNQPPRPCKNPRLTRGPVEIYFFFLSFLFFPQVAFPCKMPDMTPEGNLGVGGAPERATQGLKYKLEGRGQVGKVRDSTRDMASHTETEGFFCRKKLCRRARG